MKKMNLAIKTLTPIIDLENLKQPLFAINSSYIYFLNLNKLDKLLSVMMLLGEFNEYCNSITTHDISLWLRNRKLLTKEILEECSYYKIKYTLKNKPNIINTPFYSCFCSSKFDYILINNLKRIIIFNYLKNNNLEINEYISELITFFKNNHSLFKENKNNFSLFLDFLFEKRKHDIQKELETINSINISSTDIHNFDDCFCLKAIDNNYFEAIKSNVIINFKLDYTKKLEEYFQLFEYTNTLRINTEKMLLQKSLAIATKDIDNYQDKICLSKNIASSNMSFLNYNQIFYLSLTKENIEELNQLFNCNVMRKIFCVDEQYNQSNFYNYAKFEIN